MGPYYIPPPHTDKKHSSYIHGHTDTPLSLDSIVLFWPEGNDSIRPKGSQPKLARVIELEDGPDGKQRRALLSYIKASQVLLNSDYQIKSAPFKETWQRIDELIPVDDASHP